MKKKELSAVFFIFVFFASCRPIATASVPRNEVVLISYTNYVDGGDELINCLEGYSQPNFILYENGHLVVYKSGQYWEASLNEKEINSLLAEIKNSSGKSRIQDNLHLIFQHRFDRLKSLHEQFSDPIRRCEPCST